MEKEKIFEKNIIQERIKLWAEKLIDLSGKNDLISYREAKTISITPSKEIVDKLLEGSSVKISEIIDLEDKDLRKGAFGVVKKAVENFEDYGIEVLRLISGFVSWESDVNKPYAPLVTYSLSIENPGQPLKNIEISLTDVVPEINTALVLHLNKKCQAEISIEKLEEVQEEGEEVLVKRFLDMCPKEISIEVKDGFARNYLIPQKKALRANKENKVHFTKIKQDLIEKNNKIVEEAKKSLKIISGEEIIFIRNASDNGQLYGSVSPKDISNYFNQKKIDIKPSNINLHSAIKKVGIYNINIKLHAEVTCDLKINVATSNENAKLQKSEVNKVESSDEKKEDKDKKDEILLESKKSISEKKEINKKESEKIESIKKASAKSETKIKKEESDLEKDIKKKDK